MTNRSQLMESFNNSLTPTAIKKTLFKLFGVLLYVFYLSDKIIGI